MSRITLNTACFTIERGADDKLFIATGTLRDFDSEIERTTRPTGVGCKYYATKRGDRPVLAKWATWGGPEVVVREFDTEAEAEEAAEDTYVYDILHSGNVTVYLDRAEAERALAQAVADEE